MSERRRRGAESDVRWWERHGPRLPARGIKAQTRQGAFGKSWWASRWIGALERLVDPGRLARGRSYARSGQVLALDVVPGGVAATVQGSRPTPYRVSVRLRALDDAAWERVLDMLAGQALYAARLLSGEMPEDVEEVFQAVGTSLMPIQSGDLQTSCTCPDWMNPCKHVAAVHYLLGERFDEDPFLLFLLRGRSRDQLLDGLRARRTGPAAAGESAATVEDENAPLDLVHFWTTPADHAEIALKFALPEVDALVVKRLGPAPFVRDQHAFVTAMERIYLAISEHALSLALRDDAAEEVQ